MSGSVETTRRPPGWVRTLNGVARRLIGEGDSGRVPLNVAIDVHKAATGLVVVILMQAYDVFTAPAWTYLALHGSYGVAWVVKDMAVGDKRWRHRVGPLRVLGTWTFLTLYWVAPYVLVMGSAGELEGSWAPASTGWLAVAIVAYVVGLVLMIGADAQKNATLAARERAARGGATGGRRVDAGLITTGFFARSRHPNYLGEMLIYGAFAVVASHWIPWLILAAVWGLFFVPNMLAIEASLSRYPEYEEWRQRTGFLLPKLRR